MSQFNVKDSFQLGFTRCFNYEFYRAYLSKVGKLVVLNPQNTSKINPT